MFKTRPLACVLCLVILLAGIKCCAKDLTQVNEPSSQVSEIEKSGAIIKIQKQPVTDTTKQKISVQKSFFCIVIQVNGKIKEELK